MNNDNVLQQRVDMVQPYNEILSNHWILCCRKILGASKDVHKMLNAEIIL